MVGTLRYDVRSAQRADPTVIVPREAPIASVTAMPDAMNKKTQTSLRNREEPDVPCRFEIIDTPETSCSLNRRNLSKLNAFTAPQQFGPARHARGRALANFVTITDAARELAALSAQGSPGSNIDHPTHTVFAVRATEVGIRSGLRESVLIHRADVSKRACLAIHVVGRTKLPIGNARCATRHTVTSTCPRPAHRVTH